MKNTVDKVAFTAQLYKMKNAVDKLVLLQNSVE
jgi:hypothetical protein